ncbi:MAG: RnfABCDGE type electron transport complex subunit G [bacterium]
MKTIINYTLRLTIVSIVASGLLAYVYQTTYERIKENKEKEKVEKIKSVLPEVDNINEVERNGKIIYQGVYGGELKGTVIEVSEQGYAGPVKLLVGVDTKGRVIAINVLSHKETPGLGNKIEDQWFKDQFKKKDYEGVTLKRDSQSNSQDAVSQASGYDRGIDAITAATISSRAVVKAVRKALSEFNK